MGYGSKCGEETATEHVDAGDAIDGCRCEPPGVSMLPVQPVPTVNSKKQSLKKSLRISRTLKTTLVCS
uniref:Uncharacterized protein n=1 Tax=Parascaris equorum TaxID=6256 RepID=A0A914REG1_PAREQ